MRSLLAVRYLLPFAVFLGGFVLYAIEPNGIGLDGLAMATGAALSILLLNLLFRIGVHGERERAQEDAAREYFAEHGRWPDESR
jgi:hypothetical protein